MCDRQYIHPIASISPQFFLLFFWKSLCLFQTFVKASLPDGPMKQIQRDLENIPSGRWGSSKLHRLFQPWIFNVFLFPPSVFGPLIWKTFLQYIGRDMYMMLQQLLRRDIKAYVWCTRSTVFRSCRTPRHSFTEVRRSSRQVSYSVGWPSIAQQPVHTSNTGWWLDVWVELQGAVNSLPPIYIRFLNTLPSVWGVCLPVKTRPASRHLIWPEHNLNPPSILGFSYGSTVFATESLLR